MRKSTAYFILVSALVGALLVSGCAQQRKVAYLAARKIGATIQLPREVSDREHKLLAGSWGGKIEAERDTLIVTDDKGKEVLLMKAIRSDNGEMVASDVLDAAVVTARFRNIAERNGKIDLEFQVVVPEKMQNSQWQVRLSPYMSMLDEYIKLDDVIITGRDYRLAQLRGYEQYEKWLQKIIEDNGEFIRRRDLEIFLERNLPEVWLMRLDTTFVSDEQFESLFGVTEQEAVDHYTRKWAMQRNEKRKLSKDFMFHKLVKSPIITEGLRLDTVFQKVNGDFVYNYIQRVNTRPKLRKIDITLQGGIYEGRDKIYDIPKSDPLTFYISSLSSFADPREKYLSEVVERLVTSSAECNIEFAVAKSNVDLKRGLNYFEIRRIKDFLKVLLENEVFGVDSVVVTSGASPEGEWSYNQKLAGRRGESVSQYFGKYMRFLSDSLSKSSGFSVDERGKVHREKFSPIAFTSHTGGEDWDKLTRLVGSDEVLTDNQKAKYQEALSISNLDEREKALKVDSDAYEYMRDSLYPRLRNVHFDFHLFRKNMQKDTVHTTVLDTVYARGVTALVDHDYKTAATLLRPYEDYNTAVAYTAMDYNQSALELLKKLPREPRVSYMLALVYSRTGDMQKAVQCYLDACRKEHAYIYRGNLDPEIAELVRTYSLADMLSGLNSEN